MIPFQTWLSQILGYCHLVADDIGLKRAWVDRDYSRSSVTNFDELYEQMFDDLDSDNMQNELAVRLPNVAARKAVTAFLDAIRIVDNLREKEQRLLCPIDLLQSNDWKVVVEAGKAVVLLLGSTGADQSHGPDSKPHVE